jgi:hypothetical protein
VSGARKYNMNTMGDARRSSGKTARIHMRTLSCFALESIYSHYVLRGDFLANITDKRFLGKKYDVRATVMAQYSPSDLVLRTKTYIMKEFDEPFPLARINWFAVMGLVLDVWKAIAVQITKPNLSGVPEDMRDIPRFSREHIDFKPVDLEKKHVNTATRFMRFSRRESILVCERREGDRKKSCNNTRG